MPVATVQKLPREPIVLIRQPAASDMLRDIREQLPDTIALFDAQAAPCSLVIDVSEIVMRIDIVSRAAQMSTAVSADLLRHPKVREIVMVTRSDVVKRALDLMHLTIYRGIAMRAFDTLDEALAYCRSQP